MKPSIAPLLFSILAAMHPFKVIAEVPLFSGVDYSFSIVSLETDRTGTKNHVTLRIHYELASSRGYELSVTQAATRGHEPEGELLSTWRYRVVNDELKPNGCLSNTALIQFDLDQTSTEFWVTLWRSWHNNYRSGSGNFPQSAALGLDGRVIFRRRIDSDKTGSYFPVLDFDGVKMGVAGDDVTFYLKDAEWHEIKSILAVTYPDRRVILVTNCSDGRVLLKMESNRNSASGFQVTMRKFDGVWKVVESYETQ